MCPQKARNIALFQDLFGIESQECETNIILCVQVLSNQRVTNRHWLL